ncbi:MAG: 50S ribosomal protein L6 [Chloroflexi bacterium RBG_13_50_10]|nr:MAG: 50S ribosomal protein L6 [Chloroflexi bacterium RBG_13_50_10]
MSRVGLLPIPVPQGVKVNIKGNEVTVEGSKGKLVRPFHPDISITLKDGNLIVARPTDNRNHRALHGLTRSLLANMVEGVTKGFEKVLELSGVGYRAQKAGNKLSLQIGFSHPVDFSPPAGIEIVVEGTNRVRISGIDKELVGETAAQIRAVRRVDSYKGKGIKYAGERLRLKPGKAGKAALKG